MDFNYFMWNRTLGTIFKALERIVCLETYRMYRDVREKGTCREPGKPGIPCYCILSYSEVVLSDSVIFFLKFNLNLNGML